MTTDPQPGPELDALVAVRWMGWTRRGPDQWTHEATRQWSVQAKHIPKYSESIKAAMSVWDACFPDSWGLHRYEGKWHVVNHGPPHSDWWLELASADSAPHAICLAALLAVVKASR